MILPEHYGTYVPHAGDEIWLFPEWGYVPGLTEALIYAGVSLVVGLAVATASHFLFRPKPLLLPQQNQMTEPPERTFSFEGIRTAIGPGNTIPVIYGRHRVGGQLLQASVDHAQTIVDSGAPGIVRTITGVGGGEPGQLLQVTAPGHGFADGNSVQIDGVQGKSAANNLWAISIINGDMFYLLQSTGVDGNAYTGGGTATLYYSGIRHYQAVTTPPTLSLLLALGEGSIDAVLTDTIRINDQPIGNFPGVQVFTRLGFPDQPAIGEFGEQRNTFADGRDIPVSPGIITTTTTPVHAIVLNIVFNQGLFFLNAKGEKEGNTVILQYRVAVAGTGSWSPWSQFHISADRTSPVRLGIRREGFTLSHYDVHVEMVTAFKTSDVQAKYQPTLESLTEVVSSTSNYSGTTLLGIRALASDALRGSLPNITVEVRGLIVRVGSLGPTRVWSDNPAWCVLDFLVDPRYGMSVP